MSSSTGRGRRGHVEPKEVRLTQEKDRGLGHSLFRPDSEITLSPNQRFVILPGEKGHGWVLKVYDDAAVSS